MPDPIFLFQSHVSTQFRQLTLAMSYFEIGSRYLASAPPTASVALRVAPDLTTEPLRLSDLLPHTFAVAHSIAELFQMKIVSAWSDLLNQLVTNFVADHVAGVRLFSALKKRTATVDFSADVDLLTQLQQGLATDFAFESYTERVRVVARVLDPDGERAAELAIVKKHVQIRNVIQHHASCVTADMLRELGVSRIEVFDPHGETVAVSLGQSIPLHFPELNNLKAALFRISNTWGKQLA